MNVLTPEPNYHYKSKITGDIYEYQVFLGKNDSVENYELVSEEEYKNWLKKAEEETNETIDKVDLKNIIKE